MMNKYMERKRKKNLYSTQLDYVKVLLEDNMKQQALKTMQMIINKLEVEIKKEK